MKEVGKGVKFERIRRITGYLVGFIDLWNNAKSSEEKDRVKHGITDPHETDHPEGKEKSHESV